MYTILVCSFEFKKKKVFKNYLLIYSPPQSSGPRRAQVSQLLRDLARRGSQAFPAFLECLRETGQHTLAELLESGDSASVPVPLPVRPNVIPLPVCKCVSQKDNFPQCKILQHVHIIHVHTKCLL